MITATHFQRLARGQCRRCHHRARRRTAPIAMLAVGLALLLGLSGAAGASSLRIAYVDWSSSVASANVVCAVLNERLDQPCELIETSADEMWRLVAEGEADVMLSAWLPDTHADYYAQYGEQLDDLGPNLVGTRTGLVIPATGIGRQTDQRGAHTQPTLNIQSIEQLPEHRQALAGRIIGIDPEAGIMAATEQALADYRLTGFRLIPGAESTMTASLADAITRNRPIVVTGWVPHWMFGRWSLRFLDDPKGVYGDSGSIHSMARPGLAEDFPAAAALIERFAWDADSMEQLLIWIHQDRGRDPYAQALRWMRTHPQHVNAWLTETPQTEEF